MKRKLPLISEEPTKKTKYNLNVEERAGGVKGKSSASNEKARRPNLSVREHFTAYDAKGVAWAVPVLKEFDFNLLQPDYTVVAFGKRRTGKSFMFRWIMSKMAHFYAFILVFTNTKSNNFWQKMVPERFIHRGFNPAVVHKFLRWQDERKNDPKLKDANLKSLIIEDDVISDTKLRYMKEQNALFTEGRHYDAGVYVTTQSAKGINPTLRENADVAFFFYMHSKNQKKSIYEDYLDFLEEPVFEALWKKYTIDNMCLVIVTNPMAKCFTGDPLDCLFWARAEDPGEFVLGCEEYWTGKGPMMQ